MRQSSRTGQPRETPVAWFAAVELRGSGPVPVVPDRLDGAVREQARQRIAGVQPRIGKYQSKAGRDYPVVRLIPR